ncbi:MAG: PAS domain S-box protein [Anaerolineae bacterium]|nr:PAS domain S-box protein [Anaerolineae bacterium]
MNWHYAPYTWLLLVAAVISVTLALYVWRRRTGPGATPFVLFMLAIAEWSLAGVFVLLSVDLSAKLFWANVQYLGAVVVPPLWLLFALQYTGQQDKWFIARYPALLLIEPLVALILLWTNPWHQMFRSNARLDTSGSFPVLAATHEPAFWAHTFYSYGLLLVGTFLIIYRLTHSTQLYRGQSAALLVGVFTPWAVNVMFMLNLIPFDPTPCAFTVSGAAFAWGLFRYRLLDIVPAARDAVLESMRDGVIVLDTQNRVVDLNPMAQQIIGCSASQALGQPITNLLNWPDQGRNMQVSKEVYTETMLNNGTGGDHYFDLRLSPLYQDDNLVGRLAVLHDVTERKQAEQEKERLIEELNAFAHTVAHDLKNPLSTVIGFSMLLEEDFESLPKKDLRELLHSISHNSRKMNNIIDEILTLAGVRKLERVPQEPLDMALVVAETHHRLAYMIEEYQAVIVLPGKWPVACGYGPWVEEIWANYLSNAIKYGGDPPYIELGATEQDDGMVRFWVRDNGQGLTPEQQTKLFMPFTRLHQTRALGHGLGLSIVQRIAEKLGGGVGVESAPGAGSVFSFTLPRAGRKT